MIGYLVAHAADVLAAIGRCAHLSPLVNAWDYCVFPGFTG